MGIIRKKIYSHALNVGQRQLCIKSGSTFKKLTLDRIRWTIGPTYGGGP